jgi:plasmid stabilization system protein ParE
MKCKGGVLLPEARADVTAIRAWYERQRPGTGRKFQAQVREAVLAIGRLPEGYPPSKGATPAFALCPDFRTWSSTPYVVLYRVEPSRVVVFAVIHGHRDPADWP